MKLIYLDAFGWRSFSHLILNFFTDHYHNSRQKCFPIMRKNALYIWYRKLGFCYKQHNENIQVYQCFVVDVETPLQVFPENFLIFLAWNFIRNYALVQLFSCKFSKLFKNTYFEKRLCVAASNKMIIAIILL